MDFSTKMTSKNNKDFEINVSPIPSGFRKSVEKSGIYICCYYENVPSHLCKAAKTAYHKNNMRRFPYFVLAHLIGGDGIYTNESLGKWVNMEPGWGVIATPFRSNAYGGKQRYFIEDSICFNGPSAQVLFESGIIKYQKSILLHFLFSYQNWGYSYICF